MRHPALLFASLIALASCERPNAAASSPTATATSQMATEATTSPPEPPPAAPRSNEDPAPVDPNAPLHIASEPGDASSDMHELLRGEVPVRLPRAVQKSFENALAPRLLHDVVLVYDSSNAMHTYHVDDARERTVLELSPKTDLLEYGWLSPDERTLAVLIREESSFPSLSFLSIAEDGSASVVSTATPKPPPMVRCASRCYVAGARFDSATEFSYIVRGGPEDPINPSSEPEFQTVSVPAP